MTPGLFRLGLYGVYTAPISTFDDEATVESAFNSLPLFSSDESVTVVRNDNFSTDASFTFTFESRRGDFPSIDVGAVADYPVLGANITEDSKGSPDTDFITLSFDGAVSVPFSISELSAEKLQTVIDSFFHAQCPDDFSGKGNAFIYEDYEEYKYRGYSYGTVTVETEPFCGRYSLKNPDYLLNYVSVPLFQNSQLCFAYKGLIQNNIWLSYKYQLEQNSISRTDLFEVDFRKDSEFQSVSWYYNCFDMLSLILSKGSISALSYAAASIKLYQVMIARSAYDSNIYIDALYIGNKPTVSDLDMDEINIRRRPIALANNSVIDQVYVSSTNTMRFVITLIPYVCGSHSFPLIRLENSEVLNGSSDVSSLAAKYMLSNSESGTLNVHRKAAASPPVLGNIDIEFKGRMKRDLNISLNATMFGKELESLVGIGDLSVTKSGDCANFKCLLHLEVFRETNQK